MNCISSLKKIPRKMHGEMKDEAERRAGGTVDARKVLIYVWTGI
jgi:hypothetical protein